MAIRKILRMGDSRLLRESEPVSQFNTPELNQLIEDMYETMYAADGAGLAAPQIGVNQRVVIFGYDENNRYPDAPPVPKDRTDQSRLSVPSPMRSMRVGKVASPFPECAG